MHLISIHRLLLSTATYNNKTKTYLVVDKVAGRDGTDTFKNVEVIRFTDGDQVTMSLSTSDTN